MNEWIVVAFGGNAIMTSAGHGSIEEQQARVRFMSEQLCRLILAGHRVLVTHGNGPQVGEILLRSDVAAGVVPPMSMDVAGAMSQGQIGYMLQQEIRNVLATYGSAIPVCSVVTQVVVDAADPAFHNPTKPVGRFYEKHDAGRLNADRGWTMIEDAGRGYRRVVPSPLPIGIVEWPAVKALLDAGVLVIAAGGGGIPVIVRDGRIQGTEAVIDKDRSAQKLASLVGAGVMVLLTEVDAVAIDFGTPRQRVLGPSTLEDIKRYRDQGHFPAGSMGPKVSAAIEFIERGGERAIITSAGRLVDAIDDTEIGTQILRAEDSSAQQRSSLAAKLS